MSCRPLLLLCLCSLLCISASAQKKIVILGSSTAAGNGASVYDSSWARRLYFEYNKNTTDGIDTSIENLALQGFVTYNVMPTTFPAPANRTSWPVDTYRNVTRALSLSPNVIIISLPSNDLNLYPDYHVSETMNNFRQLFQLINSTGIPCFITTSQPRNDMTAAQRDTLHNLVDSISNNFGIYAINFYADLVTNDGQYNFRDDRRADLMHPNDIGHRFLFERVKARHIFSISNAPLPVALTQFDARVQSNAVLLTWHTEHEEPNSLFDIQRSTDARNYTSLHAIHAQGNSNGNYSWSDASSPRTKSFYRLKITEPSGVSYSKIIALTGSAKKTAITRLFIDPSSGLHVDFSTNKSGSVVLSIVNTSGSVVAKRAYKLVSTDTRIVWPIPALPAGSYFLILTTTDGSTDTQRFNWLNN